MRAVNGRRRSRAAALGATLVLAISGIAACGDDNAGENAAGGSAESAKSFKIGLITKTDTNPFWVKMREGAEKKAADLGVELQYFAGKDDADNEGQVAAVENLVAGGAKGILIAPANSSAIVPALDKAREAGVTVIGVDTETEPPDATDVTFATDNYKAGLLIGEWAKAKFEADGKLKDAKIAMLDINTDQVSVDVQRNQGFLKGFGVDVKDESKMFDEDDPRIVGHGESLGQEERGRTAMENLIQKDPGVNLVYTINEPAAFGAYQAIKAAGKEKQVTVVSVDGGCPGVEGVKDGRIDATSQQYPLKMAAVGVQTVVDQVRSEKPLPKPPAASDFIDTGVTLITDEPVEGVESENSAFGLDNCWG